MMPEPGNKSDRTLSILLIGGTGTISFDVLKHSLEAGHKVYILNRGRTKVPLPDGVLCLHGDVRALKGDGQELLGDLHFDVVIDFISFSVSDLSQSLRLFGNRCRQFIFISSVGAYDRRHVQGRLDESCPATGNPVWQYSVDKAACEDFLKHYQFPAGTFYTIVRPAVTYGDTRIPYGIMPAYGCHWTFLGRMLAGKPVFVWDHGKATATVMHTLDFARAFIGLFGNPRAENETFNLCGDEEVAWKDMLSQLAAILKCECRIVDVPSEYAEKAMPQIRGILLGDRALNASYSNQKIKQVCPDFRISMDLRHGLERTIDYYREHQFLKGIDYHWDGMIDRMLACYLKKYDPDSPMLSKLVFYDYLGTATLKDRFSYLRSRYIPYRIQYAYESLMRAFWRMENRLFRR